VLAVAPFHIFAILTYCGVLYGLVGLKPGVQPFARFTCVSTLVYMSALQVRKEPLKESHQLTENLHHIIC
jgi:hypothetical protein